MAPPRHFGTACEIESSVPGALPPRHFDPDAGFSWKLLQRHGKRPLALLGRTLLEANNSCAGLPDRSEITIQETSTGRFAAEVRHEAAAPGGFAWCDAKLCDHPEAIRAWFYGHDPVAALSLCPVPRLAAGDLADIERFVSLAAHNAVAAERFRGAWAGLLAAVFGLPAAHRAAA